MIEEHPKDLIELVFEYGKNHETRSVKIKRFKFVIFNE